MSWVRTVRGDRRRRLRLEEVDGGGSSRVRDDDDRPTDEH